MDYLGPNFTKLKYTNVLTPESGSINLILTYTPTTISTWLCPKIFYHWTRNLDSSAPKHSELLVNHHGDLRSEGHLYPYSSRATLDKECSAVGHVQWWCTPISYLHAILVSPHLLVMRINNAYNT